MRVMRGPHHRGLIVGPLKVLFTWPVRTYLRPDLRWRFMVVDGSLFVRTGPVMFFLVLPRWLWRGKPAPSAPSADRNGRCGP